MFWFEGCFFLTQFPYVAGDSELVIRAFHHLHTVKHPHWVDFITEKGNIERFEDFFIGHLTVPKDEMMNPPIELNLFVCDLLLDLVLGNKGLQMRVKVVKMLFKAVLGAIDAFMEGCAMGDSNFRVLLRVEGECIATFDSKLHPIMKFTQRSTVS
jgi:hypothetical protein